MRRIELADIEGVRWLPDAPTGTGALVLAGSSGRVDSARAELLARHGAVAESIRWFGGPQQHSAPWEIPLELFLGRVADLARECDRVLVLGNSFGAEAALLTGAYSPHVATVVGFAPSDVVWAGVRGDGTVTSHWTLEGVPLHYVPVVDDWQSEEQVPSFVGLYCASRQRFRDHLAAAAIPVERIAQLMLVAGGDDQVWPSLTMAEAIKERRSAHGLSTTLVSDPGAGHRTVLPGEPAATGGQRMRRGGTDAADRRLGIAAWAHIADLL